MPIETGQFCQYCVDENGDLQTFGVTVARMLQFITRQEPGLTQADSEAKTLAHMASMPAWRNLPGLKARSRRS
jgi:hypothetical protein